MTLNYPIASRVTSGLNNFARWPNCEDFERFIWSRGTILPEGMNQQDLELRFEIQIMPRLIELWEQGTELAGSYPLQQNIVGGVFIDFDGHFFDLTRVGQLLELFSLNYETFFAAMFYADVPSHSRKSIFCDSIMSHFPFAYSQVQDEQIKMLNVDDAVRYISILPIHNWVDSAFLSEYSGIPADVLHLHRKFGFPGKINKETLVGFIEKHKGWKEFNLAAIDKYGFERLLPTESFRTWLQGETERRKLKDYNDSELFCGLSEVGVDFFQDDVRIYPHLIIMDGATQNTIINIVVYQESWDLTLNLRIIGDSYPLQQNDDEMWPLVDFYE
jgi:hypothetical protein